MQRFIEIVTRFKEHITLVILVIMSLSFMSFGNVAKLGGFRAVAIGGIGLLQSAFAWIPNPVALKTENSALRELNLQLSNEVVKIRQSVIENDKLRSMLEFRNKSAYPLIPASVIGKVSNETRNFITIDKGSKNNIKEGMAVITDAGLVGKIIGTSDSYSLVQVAVNRDSRISAKIQRTRDDGIVVWQGDEYLVMQNIPKGYDVQAGDEVITSEYSKHYPANIVIGRISEITTEGNSLFRKIIIKPSVNFSSLEQVFVMQYLPDPERIEFERKLEEKLESKSGLK